MLGQRSPGRPLALECLDLGGRPALGFQVGRRIEVGCALLQVLERQHELVELGAPLRGGAEALPPELGDLELELLDLDLERKPRRLGERRVGFGGFARRPFGLGHLASPVSVGASGAGLRLGRRDLLGHRADERVR